METVLTHKTYTRNLETLNRGKNKNKTPRLVQTRIFLHCDKGEK